MEKPDAETAPELKNADDSNSGSSMSIELTKVRHALSVKVQKHGAHYTHISPLGKGSFGEVHSAHDELLGRDVAIKSIKNSYREEDPVIHRFLKEARGSAQLEHPNIMPVHEMGMSDQLGIYFTMKKIEGKDLKKILDNLQSNPEFYQTTYTLHFLLEIFLAVCNGVAFAHSKGVIHRDLKPANIMVGQYGEVLILDWGLVKKVGVDDTDGGQVQLQMDESDEGVQTLDGAVSGTPNYMSPEQAMGKISDIGFPSDVYSLGAILYHILTYSPPFEKTQVRRLLENVKTGNFIPPRKRFPERNVPRELEAVCLKAMSNHAIQRYPSVEHLAQDIRNYIGNFEVTAYRAPRRIRIWKACKRNPVKSSMTAAALAALLLAFMTQRAMLFGSYRSIISRADELRLEGNADIDEATQLYSSLELVRAASELKTETSTEQDLANSLEKVSSAAASKYNVAEMLYESVPEPYRRRQAVIDGYVDIIQRRINFALHCRQYDLAQQQLETIRLRIEQPDIKPGPEASQRLNNLEDRIAGRGLLDIIGPATIRDVIVWPLLDSEDRPRKIQGDAIKRGRLPLHIENISKGSYVLQVTRADGGIMPFPVHIGHGEHTLVDLDLPETVPEGMVYVPGGDFIFGGEESRFYRKSTRTLPSFYIKTHEVTVGEYIEFWKSLTLPDERSRYMSRLRFRPQDRRYEDAWDGRGILRDDRLSLEYPVVGVTREAAEAFCAWKSRQTGSRIRLPSVEEWEKAARGVDGRRYVWGNGFSADANLALTKSNEKGKLRYPLWAPPGSFPRDITIYGAYDMAGNVREMTSTPLPSSTVFFQFKGGSASTPENFLPCSYSSDTAVVPSDVGFRYIQEK